MWLAHLLHRHTVASKPGVGDIAICHRRRRTDAHVRPAGFDWWMRLRGITPEELAELAAVDGPAGGSYTGGDRLLYVAWSIRARRQTQ